MEGLAVGGLGLAGACAFGAGVCVCVGLKIFWNGSGFACGLACGFAGFLPLVPSVVKIFAVLPQVLMTVSVFEPHLKVMKALKLFSSDRDARLLVNLYPHGKVFFC